MIQGLPVQVSHTPAALLPPKLLPGASTHAHQAPSRSTSWHPTFGPPKSPTWPDFPPRTSLQLELLAGSAPFPSCLLCHVGEHV